MVSAFTDRFDGAQFGQAIKSPCVVISTSNLTLSGEQTVNSVAVVENDRVLVNGQTDQTENGIWVVETGAWVRAPDFDGNRDALDGTLVTVKKTTGMNFFYQLDGTNPIVIGTSNIVFLAANDPNVSWPIVQAEIDAGLTTSDINDSFEPGDVRRHGDVSTGTDHTSILQNALSANATITLPPGVTIFLDELNIAAAGKRIIGAGRFSTVIRPIVGITSGNALIHNANRATGTSYGFSISDVKFELHDGSANVNCIGIDLGSIGTAQIQRCRFDGFAESGANATGVLFEAPLSSASYFNSIIDCDFQKLEFGVDWGQGANGERLYNCQFNNCTTGCSVADGTTTPDSAWIGACRFESCTTGIVEDSRQATYIGNRFEANTTDMDFGVNSDDCHIFGGSTASSGTVLKNISNVSGLVFLAPDLGAGQYRSDSASRALFIRGPLILSPWDHSETDTTPGGQSQATVAVYAAGGRVVLDNAQWLTWIDNAGTGAVLGWSLDANDELRTNVPMHLKSYTVAGLPAVPGASSMIYVSDETGGAIPAFSDGTNWRRVSDRAIVA